MNTYLIFQYAYFKWAHTYIYDMHRHFLFLLEKKKHEKAMLLQTIVCCTLPVIVYTYGIY